MTQLSLISVSCFFYLLCVGILSADPSARDMERANQPRPTSESHVYGSHPHAAWEAMNRYLLGSKVSTVACDRLSHEDLNSMYLDLMPHLDERFDILYKSRNDRRSLKFSNEEITTRWEKEAEKAREPGFEEGTFHYNMLRDGKCAELVMWWIHHLTETSQEDLQKNGFVLPLMPEDGPVDSQDPTYVYQVQCTDCHSSPNANATLPSDSPKNPHEKVGGDRETCPIDPKTGNPTVWYQDPTLAGQRFKRCDWDYDPPCQVAFFIFIIFMNVFSPIDV
uniref:Sulfhydryl oxidase n=1 Tax=Paramoeba aestuarina TaxID=180227 RepID=A0A7S4KRT8_9EUKA